MSERKILIWFRNDLRLHDNEMLVEAVQKSDQILPVFIFDPAQFSETSYGTMKMGVNRAQFLLDSVEDLRNSFKSFGGNLLVLIGKPERILPDLVKEHEISEVYHHREVAIEETLVSSLVEDALWKLRVNLKHFIGHTLFNKEDLPFPIKDIPDSFAKFKKKTEREAIVKECMPVPDQITFVDLADYGELPNLSTLFNSDIKVQEVNVKKFVGGETEALRKLDGLFEGSSTTEINEVFGFSPWLSLGCLSPRRVFHKLNNTVLGKEQQASFSKIILGLFWRDYFRFMFKKYGNNFFKITGFSNVPPYSIEDNPEAFNHWKQGNTGQEEVDSIMKQLSRIGYVDTLSRNLTLTYYIEVLKLDWTMGAAYFEEALIDYAPASNWGNWAIYAGVGNDKTMKPLQEFEVQLKNYKKNKIK